MKSLPLVLLLCVGCTQTVVTTPNWTLRRTSVLQRMEVPLVHVATNGTVTLRGYRTDGGADAAATVAAAAVTAAIKSVAP